MRFVIVEKTYHLAVLLIGVVFATLVRAIFIINSHFPRVVETIANEDVVRTINHMAEDNNQDK